MDVLPSGLIATEQLYVLNGQPESKQILAKQTSSLTSYMRQGVASV